MQGWTPLPASHVFAAQASELAARARQDRLCQSRAAEEPTSRPLKKNEICRELVKVIRKGAALPPMMMSTQLIHTYRRFFFSFLWLCSHCRFSHTWWLFSQMPVLGVASKFCAPRAAWASGSPLGHVLAHFTPPGDRGAAGALLHSRLELGDHWHLCPDRDGPWYGAFSLPSGLGGALQA